MPCYAPLTAFRSKEFGPTGKRGITFDRNASFSGLAMQLPCGQCIGCRLEKSRQWAVRCMHEKQLHEDNCFVTLTYAPEHEPEGGTLVKRDLVLFMKRLRKEMGNGIRFYACGEYGERLGRPHYHLILFGCDFPDKKFYSSAKRGEKLYTSDCLRKLWPFGHNVIGDVTFDSCAYVARYIMKKVTGDNAGSHYQVLDENGVVYDQLPEFTNMSRRPGIGLPWFEKFGDHSYKFDKVVINGKEVRPPRYYDTKYEVLDADRLAMLKRKRQRKAAKSRKENLPDRRRVRETVAHAKLSLNKRVL